MQKWEYNISKIPARPEKAVVFMNKMGADGWEYAEIFASNITGMFYLFKRPTH